MEFERFASMSNPHLAGQCIAITPLNWSGNVSVSLWMDWAVRNRDCAHLRLLHAQPMSRDRILMATETAESRIRVGQAFRCGCWVHQTAPPKARHLSGDGRIGAAFDLWLECDQKAVFERVISTYTCRDRETTSVERCCLELLRDSRGAAYGACRRRHVAAWARRWAGADVRLDGPQDDQRAIRFAVFHLIQSCPQRDTGVSIAAKGLTGEGYRGHVFWDTEIFMLPFFAAADPPSARRLLLYRHRTLDGARRKARQMGYAGAMFPWESAETGDETCPPYVRDARTGELVRVLTGELQHHISADVVYAAWRYAQAAGDEYFRERQLLELAVAAARFWASRVLWNPKAARYEIRRVIGPDEYHEEVDNNAFTNYLAAWNLRHAAQEVERMKAVHRRSHVLRHLAVTHAETSRWRAIADKMFLPAGPGSGLIEQHQGFFKLRQADPQSLTVLSAKGSERRRMRRIRRAQVLKQADVLMLPALFPEHFPAPAKKANWDYYEPRTTHDSSLSPAVHSIVASDLNLRERAYDYFRRSAMIDLEDRMGNAAAGLHCAALGGTWQAVVRGFLGLGQEGDAPEVRPRLPGAWKGLSMRVRHHGRWYSVQAAGDESRVQLIEKRAEAPALGGLP